MHGATNKVIRALADDGTVSAEHDPKIGWEDLRFVYRHMVETRLLDERLTALQRQGRIGFHVGCLGEEAAIIGSAFAMRKQDWPALMSRLHELHPYQTPECVAVRIASGAPAYMAWLEAALEPETT